MKVNSYNSYPRYSTQTSIKTQPAAKEVERKEIEAATKQFLKAGGKIDNVEGSERNATYNISFRKGSKDNPVYATKKDQNIGANFTINAKKAALSGQRQKYLDELAKSQKDA